MFSLYRLAFCYEINEDIQDKSKAFELYEKSAENGFVPSQYELANCYKYGKGVKKNKIEALDWFKLYQQNDGNLNVTYDIKYVEKELVKRYILLSLLLYRYIYNHVLIINYLYLINRKKN